MSQFFRSRHISVGVLVGGVLLGCILSGIFLALLSTSRPRPAPRTLGTAVMQVIPAPSHTPVLPTAAPTTTLTPEPGPPAPSGEVIVVGAYVQITGTGVDGLRLRSDPGLQGKTKFVAIEAEVFRISDGPRDLDGYSWYYLVNPYDETVQGWAVVNYLAVIQNP